MAPGGAKRSIELCLSFEEGVGRHGVAAVKEGVTGDLVAAHEAGERAHSSLPVSGAAGLSVSAGASLALGSSEAKTNVGA